MHCFEINKKKHLSTLKNYLANHTRKSEFDTLLGSKLLLQVILDSAIEVRDHMTFNVNNLKDIESITICATTCIPTN